MKISKWYNSLIIDYENERVYLADKGSIAMMVYNDGFLYRIDDFGYMAIADDVLLESEFDELYEEYTEYDAARGHEKLMFRDYEHEELWPYVKADKDNYEWGIRLESVHGMNTSYYDITYAEIIEGVCYEASKHAKAFHPGIEAKSFFKFVSLKGEEYYISETYPFFLDETDTIFTRITKEKFEEYD